MSDRENLTHRRVNINAASLEFLRDNVIGFGDVLAERIVAYRTEHGPFGAISELTAIVGIGPKLLSRIADQLALTSQEEAPSLVPVQEIAATKTATTSILEANAMTDTDMLEPIPETPETKEVIEEAVDVVTGDETVTETNDETVAETEETTKAAVDKLTEATGDDTSEKAEAVVEEMGDSARDDDQVAEPASILYELSQDLPEENEGDWLEDEDELDLEWPDEEEEWDDDDLEDLTPEEMAELDELIEQDLEIAELDDGLVGVEPMESEKEPAALNESIAESTRSTEAEEDPMSVAQKAAPVAAISTAPMEAASPLAEAPVPEKKRRHNSLLMVLLGGLLGVALTLLVGIILSGTIDFAPRRQVDALSRNMSTMQTNSELAWERIDLLSAHAAEIDRHLTRLDSMADTVATLETDIIAAQAELDSLESSLGNLSTQVQALEQALDETDTRVAGVEGQVGELAGSVTELEGSVQEVQTYVNRFDGFFSALRDLLLDMQGGPEAAPVSE